MPCNNYFSQLIDNDATKRETWRKLLGEEYLSFERAITQLEETQQTKNHLQIQRNIFAPYENCNGSHTGKLDIESIYKDKHFTLWVINRFSLHKEGKIGENDLAKINQLKNHLPTTMIQSLPGCNPAKLNEKIRNAENDIRAQPEPQTETVIEETVEETVAETVAEKTVEPRLKRIVIDFEYEDDSQI